MEGIPLSIPQAVSWSLGLEGGRGAQRNDQLGSEGRVSVGPVGGLEKEAEPKGRDQYTGVIGIGTMSLEKGIKGREEKVRLVGAAHDERKKKQGMSGMRWPREGLRSPQCETAGDRPLLGGGFAAQGTQGRAAQGCAGHPPSARVGAALLQYRQDLLA